MGMRNAEDGMRSVIPQDKEIASAQVLFPDRKTLDEVIAELRENIEKLKAGGASPAPTE